MTFPRQNCYVVIYWQMNRTQVFKPSLFTNTPLTLCHVYPADKNLFSRPSARSLEEFQRIHSSRWGGFISAIQANICSQYSIQSPPKHLRFNSTKERFERQKALGRKFKGFFDVIRHLPDETKGPFIEKLLKKTQDSWFLKSSVFALPIFLESSISITAGQRGEYYVWKRGFERGSNDAGRGTNISSR